MDFKIEVSEAGALRDIAVDALLLVVGEGTRQSHLGKPLWSLLSGALEADDFAFKAGRCLVLHRPAGVKARRVVFAAASGSGFKAWRAALVSGLNAIKSGGTAATRGGPVRRRRTQRSARPGAVHRRRRQRLRLSPHQAVGWARNKAEAGAVVQLAGRCTGGDAGPAARARHRRGHRAGARVRQPARQPSHAHAPGRRGHTPGQVARAGGRGAGSQGREQARHGQLRRGGAGLERAAEVHRDDATRALPRRRRRWCWWARASPSTPAASRSSRPPTWTR